MDEYAAGMYVHSLPVRSHEELDEEEKKQILAKKEQYDELAEEDIGCSWSIWMPTPETICVVPNIKTRDGFAKFTEEHADIMPSIRHRDSNQRDLLEAVGRFGDVREAYHRVRLGDDRHIPKDVKEKLKRRDEYLLRQWIRETRKEWGLKSFKADGLGIPGGKIYRWEQFYHGPSYALEAGAREYREEVGPHPTKLACFYTNIEEPDITYEKYGFWVLDTIWDVHWDKGVEEETDPPKIVPVTDLKNSGPPNGFYFSHAQMTIRFLTRIIEYGMTEYQPALEYLESEFADDGRKPLPKPKQESCSDEDLFKAEMQKLGFATS